ncbi:hypothetical protein PS893_04814 [Pseudomonas fluorescens]|nr:hypothetical protein PS893_04814 [Pseudomonas fluorescens]
MGQIKIKSPSYLVPVGASLLAMDVNDNAGCLNARVVLAFFASKLAPTRKRAQLRAGRPMGQIKIKSPSYLVPVGASLLAMDVNDNACCLNARVVQTFFASKLAPTRKRAQLRSGRPMGQIKIKSPSYLVPVGASLLAMDVNDNAGCLNARVVLAFFASKLAPTGKRLQL